MGSQSTHQLLHPTKHHNQINQLFPEKTKMKVSQVAAVLAVTASASAAPWKDGKKSWGGHWKGGWKNGLLHRCALQPRRPRRGSWPAVLEDHFGGNVNGG